MDLWSRIWWVSWGQVQNDAGCCLFQMQLSSPGTQPMAGHPRSQPPAAHAWLLCLIASSLTAVSLLKLHKTKENRSHCYLVNEENNNTIQSVATINTSKPGTQAGADLGKREGYGGGLAEDTLWKSDT